LDCYEEGDTINGDRIYAEARSISKPKNLKKGDARLKQVILSENAFARIEKKLRVTVGD